MNALKCINTCKHHGIFWQALLVEKCWIQFVHTAVHSVENVLETDLGTYSPENFI